MEGREKLAPEVPVGTLSISQFIRPLLMDTSCPLVWLNDNVELKRRRGVLDSPELEHDAEEANLVPAVRV